MNTITTITTALTNTTSNAPTITCAKITTFIANAKGISNTFRKLRGWCQIETKTHYLYVGFSNIPAAP